MLIIKKIPVQTIELKQSLQKFFLFVIRIAVWIRKAVTLRRTYQNF